MKLSAFTLMEVLVGMVLTAIISALAFYSYFLIQKQFFQLQRIQQTANNCLELRTILNRDFEKAESISIQEANISIVNKEGLIFYNIWPEGLIRYHAITPMIRDSFKLKNFNYTTFFKGEPVEAGIIDQFVIIQNIFKEAQSLSIKKTYSSEKLINFQSDEY